MAESSNPTPVPVKKKWDVTFATEDGKSGEHILVMAFDAEEAKADARALAPERFTKIVGRPKLVK